MISKGFYFSSKIEKNKGDRDFKDEEIKLTLFADDMTSFLRDIRSYRQLCVILHLLRGMRRQTTL